jgi:hypothetical protein
MPTHNEVLPRHNGLVPHILHSLVRQNVMMEGHVVLEMSSLVDGQKRLVGTANGERLDTDVAQLNRMEHRYLSQMHRIA